MNGNHLTVARRFAWVVFLLIGLGLARVAMAEDFGARIYKDAAGQTIPYRLLVPKDYDAGKKYPLVLFFHGAGERGTNNQAQLVHGISLFTKAENREKFPCFVLAPQCPENQQWVDMPWGADSGVRPTQPSAAMQLALGALDAVNKEFSVDVDRLYVTGLSMGGYATWDCITRFPSRFAAAAPICGGGDEMTVTPAVAKVPVWAFHSADDNVVKVRRTRGMIQAMRAAGGQPKYFEYFGLGHFSWGKAYDEPEILPWMFAQRLGRPDSYTLKTKAPELPAVARFPDDSEFPGKGPLRKADWFRNVWRERRLMAWNNREQDKGAVVFLGDSITHGWGSLATDFPNLKVANRGISGDVTRGVRYRLKEDVLDLNPAAVVLLIGTNDLEEQAEPKLIAENIKAILAALKSHDSKMPVILCKVMPSHASKRRPAEKIKQLNSLLEDLVKGDPQIALCDTWSIFANEQGDAKVEEFPDLLHPNAAGYARFTAALRPMLQTAVQGRLQPAGSATFLRTRGQDIVDESGNKVLLRGLGLGNWMLPEGYMWRFGDQGDRPRKIEKIVSDLIGPENGNRFWVEFRKNYITEADIKRIAELGFNSVRPALNARLFLTEGDNPSYVDEGFELLDNLVGWCKKYNLYVIIDMHGAPGGQTGANIDDSPDDQPGLFMDKRNQDRLVDLWVKIAQRYKDEPIVAAYDLLNEPLPNRTGAAAKYKDQLEPLYKRITQAIREVDKRHMITLEGVDWANDWSVFSAPFDDNLFYQFHYYCWDRPTNLKGINPYLAHRNRLNAPVWVGETGEKDNTIYWGTTQYFEANNIGWSFWPWKKMETTNTPYSIKAPEGWDAIRAYSRGGNKPSRELAQKAFDQLLKNIRLENCVYFPDVVNAMLRRLPARIEAENYGHEGLNRSYFVKDSTQNAKYYRTSEPVPVEPVNASGNRGPSGQGIRLSAEEWTAYTIHSAKPGRYAAVLKAKVDGDSAAIELSVNDHTQRVSITQSGWNEISLEAVPFQQGVNRIKLLVKSGVVAVDWVAFE